jgi:hypothetical protein
MTKDLPMNDFNPEIVQLPLTSFRYDKNKKSLSAFASDFGHREWLGLLYSDGFEKGIAINSPTTGKIAYFKLTNYIRQCEELAGWEFKPAHNLDTVKIVTVFND